MVDLQWRNGQIVDMDRIGDQIVTVSNTATTYNNIINQPGTVRPYLGNLHYETAVPFTFRDGVTMLEKIHWLCQFLNMLKEHVEAVDKDLADKIQALIDEFESFKNGRYDEYYEQKIQEWLDANLRRIFETALQTVYFGLTMDGYFCAYVPNDWAKYVQFDTGAVYGNDDYGCLIIRY